MSKVVQFQWHIWHKGGEDDRIVLVLSADAFFRGDAACRGAKVLKVFIARGSEGLSMEQGYRLEERGKEVSGYVAVFRGTQRICEGKPPFCQ
jgi:hypothetical protein